MKRFNRNVTIVYFSVSALYIITNPSVGVASYVLLSILVFLWFWYQRQQPFKYRRWRKLRRNGGSHTPQEWEALKRYQQYKCVRCGSYLRPLTKDHVLPISRGGKDNIDNIQGLCGPCNSIKGTQYIDYRD